MTTSISSKAFEKTQKAKEWKIVQKRTEKRTKWVIKQMFKLGIKYYLSKGSKHLEKGGGGNLDPIVVFK